MAACSTPLAGERVPRSAVGLGARRAHCGTTVFWIALGIVDVAHGAGSDDGLRPAANYNRQITGTRALFSEEVDMKIRDVMTRTAELTNPDDTLRRAAQMMKKCDCGVLPVAEGDRLVGMITDRDIAVRGLADGKGPDAKVSQVMTREVMYCFDDEDIQHVCQNMADIQVRRLPVVNRDKRLVGIVSLSDLAKKEANAAKALRGIARPSEQHNQAA